MRDDPGGHQRSIVRSALPDNPFQPVVAQGRRSGHFRARPIACFEAAILMVDWFNNDRRRRPRPRDRAIDEAKAVIVERFFRDDMRQVYYGRQIEVALENNYFHWITKRALNELAASREIIFETDESKRYSPHFYWPRRHRYPRRQIAEIGRLVAEFSEPNFTHALGQHGEMLADIGFADIGFRILGRKVREVDGRQWMRSGHDLDRLIVREADGVRYGVVIKNTLPYVDQAEFETKLAMCEHFRVRPLFITRMMPRNYIYTVVRAGGFCLVLGNQHYPLMADDLARRVRSRLNFPVVSIRQLPDTVLNRFLDWHMSHLP